jgi:prepilin-type N-terminal cleavage/methylation domain-containing protein
MKSSGFTLVELMAVIVILGTLAASAMPRYADLSGAARAASLSQHAGAFETAVMLVHLRWAIDGTGSFRDNLPGFGDGTVDVNTAGYPVDGTSQGNSAGANNNNIPNNNNGDLRCRRLFDALLFSPAPVCGGTGAQGVPCADHDFQAARNGANVCRYSLRDDPSRFFEYAVLTGQVTETNP